jgi:hypothetical protein
VLLKISVTCWEMNPPSRSTAFGSLTVEQTAELLGISAKTVKRDWSMAKAWLHGDMKTSDGYHAR